MKFILHILFSLILIILSFKIISLSNDKQQFKYELSELNSIKYGLFDVNIWKDKIADIIVKKINEYEITPENSEYIRGNIEAGFYKLLDELSAFLENEQNKGNWFEKIIKNVVYGIAFNKESFKTQVPLWADEVVTLIENPTTQQQLKDHLKNRIVKLINDSKSFQEKVVLNKILSKYNFRLNQVTNCKSYIENEIESTNRNIIIYSIVFILLCLTPFAIELFTTIEIENLIIIKIASLFLLLIIGISTPMLSIDVRLSSFEINLLGEKISFTNQVLYFQSKSILQVVKVLFTTLKFNSILTGFLIFIFSIIFPLSKLFSILYESLTDNYTNFSRFFIEKTGKWSMADVMVVSVFLSFLGINSFLNSLLKLTESTEEYINVVPNNNHSNLEFGILFFLLYVLLSLITKPINIENNTSKFGKTF